MVYISLLLKEASRIMQQNADHRLVKEPQGYTSILSKRNTALRARGRLPFPLQYIGHAYIKNIYQKIFFSSKEASEMHHGWNNFKTFNLEIHYFIRNIATRRNQIREKILPSLRPVKINFCYSTWSF